MKKYKHNYCVSLVIFSIYFAITLFVCAIPISIVLSYLTEYNFFQVIGVCLLGTTFEILFLSIIALLMNCIIRIFTKPKIFLSDSQIMFNNKTLELSQIQYATIYLPNFSRTNSQPLELVLWTFDMQQMIIKRPNLLIILRLKKLCINAKFEINELLKQIKFFVITGVCTGLFLILVFIFSNI